MSAEGSSTRGTPTTGAGSRSGDTTQLDNMMTGIVKVRGTFKKWSKRYAVLRPGRLLLYKAPTAGNKAKPEQILELLGCTVEKRTSKKKGFCFKIRAPAQNALTSGAIPAHSVDNCIIRVSTGADRDEWIRKINDSAVPRSMTPGGSAAASADPGTPARSTAVEFPLDRSAPAEPGSPMQATEDVDDDSYSGYDSEDDSFSNFSDGSPAKVRKGGKTPVRDEESSYTEELVEVTKVVPADAAADVQPTTKWVRGTVDADTTGGDREDTIDESAKGLVGMLLKQVRPGMDLSKVVLPTFILEPRSFLDKLSDWFAHCDLLIQVPKIKDPAQRMRQMVKWYMTGFYIRPKGVKKPYNPILGETFRCKFAHADGSETLFIAEQVSHHPPVSAFFVSNRRHGIVVNGAIKFSSAFRLTYVKAKLEGTATVYDLVNNEEYTVGFPSSTAAGFLSGTLRAEMVDTVNITNENNGMSAEIEFVAKGMFSGEYNAVKGKISRGSEVVWKLTGKWNQAMELTEAATGTTELMFDARQMADKRVPLYWVDPETQSEFESQHLWRFVTKAIMELDQKAATEEKYKLEQAQREAKKARDASHEEWQTILFDCTGGNTYRYKYINDHMFDPQTEGDDYEVNGRLYGRVRSVGTKTITTQERKRVRRAKRSAAPSAAAAAPAEKGSRRLQPPKNRDARQLSGEQDPVPRPRKGKEPAEGAAPSSASRTPPATGLPLPAVTVVATPPAAVDDRTLDELRQFRKSAEYQIRHLSKRLEQLEGAKHAKKEGPSLPVVIVAFLMLALLIYLSRSFVPALRGVTQK